MARLSEDVIIEILVKLPVKSLLRFRCVCKPWYHLTKSSTFINRHLKYHKNNDSILVISSPEFATHFLSLHCYESLNVISSQDLQLSKFYYFDFEVSGPCNGLLCLSDGKTILLCNPAMREYKVLHPRPFPSPKGLEFLVIGFGLNFDSNINDYKVVTIIEDNVLYVNKEVIVCEIYSFSTNSWRQIAHNPDLRGMCNSPGNGALLNGIYHWLAYKERFYHVSVLSFNMSTEVFQNMELPCDYYTAENASNASLTVVNEYLAMFEFTKYFCDSDPKFLNIWVMHEYGEAKSWRKQFSIGPMIQINRPLLLWNNAAIL